MIRELQVTLGVQEGAAGPRIGETHHHRHSQCEGEEEEEEQTAVVVRRALALLPSSLPPPHSLQRLETATAERIAELEREREGVVSVSCCAGDLK